MFAVDEGILQVARYKLGDPLDYFFRKRMLEVHTSQILDLILPEFSKLAGMAAPGGDADDLLARHLNPFKKKHQDPVAFWSGIVDVKGEKEFTYNVPDDFNGKLRVDGRRGENRQDRHCAELDNRARRFRAVAERAESGRAGRRVRCERRRRQ